MLTGQVYKFEEIYEPLKALKGKELHALQDLQRSLFNTFAHVYTVTAFCDLKATARLLRDVPLEQKYIGQAGLVCRGMQEILFNYLYIRSRPEERIKAYRRAAWREQKKNLTAFSEFAKGKERFSEYLKAAAAELEKVAEKIELENEFRNGSSLPARWPTPKQMRDALAQENLPEAEVLDYLNEWLYRSFSCNAHGEYDGLTTRWATEHISLRRVVAVAPPGAWLAEQSSKVLYRASEILLMLICEICRDFKLNALLPECRSLWDSLVPQSEEIEELYFLRYRKLLVSCD